MREKIDARTCIDFGIDFAKRTDLLKWVIAYYVVFTVAALVVIGGSAVQFLGQAGALDFNRAILSLAGAGFALLALLAIFTITGLFVNAFMISCAGQLASSKKYSFSKAREIAWQKMLSLAGVVLGNVIILLPVSFFVGVLQAIGLAIIALLINFVASLLVSLAFLYSQQFVVARGMRALDAIKASFRTFSGNPIETLAFFVVSTAVAFAAIIVFAFIALAVGVVLAVAVISAGFSPAVLVIGFVLSALVALLAFALFAFASQLGLGMLTKAVVSVPRQS